MHNQKVIFWDRALVLNAMVALCLFLMFGMPSAHATATAPTIPYLESSTGANWYQKDWVDVSYGMKRAAVCIKNMKANGLNDAISSVWTGSPDAATGRAIACHESNGQTGAIEYNTQPGQGGACAFQIDPKSNYAGVAKGIGVDPFEFYTKILSDPVTCAKAGRFVLTNLSAARGSEVGGLCNYFGGAHYKQFKSVGNCAMAQEILLVREYVEAANNGTSPAISYDVQDNPEEPCYGCVKVSGSMGTIAVLNCHDYSMETAGAIAKAEIAFGNALRITASNQFKDTVKAQAEHPSPNTRGSVKEKYCIDSIDLTLKGLLKMLKPGLVGIIVDAILDLIENILNAVCQVIISSVNAVLEMVCLPLPDITRPKFSIALQGLDSVTCNGLSLADFVSVGAGATTLESLVGKETLDKILPADASPTPLPSMEMIIDKIKRESTPISLFGD